MGTSAGRSLVVIGSCAAALAMTAPDSGSGATRADEMQRYEVTVTNLTRGQRFTPILVATHGPAVTLFQLGSPASAELQTLAEEGDTAPLASLLGGTPGVRDVVSGSGLLEPGRTVTLTIEGTDFDRFSVAAMLIPTNDGFFALNAVEGPRRARSVRYLSPAYDAGSERNDELCSSIPGPNFVECGGPGGGAMPSGGEEGYVHIHAGIHGIGDMNAADRDWRNPVAEILIRRVP